MLIQNLDDAGLAPLGKLRNMLIKSAITEISFSGHSWLIRKDSKEILVSTPMFYGLLILIKPCITKFGYLHIHNYANWVVITEISRILRGTFVR